MKQKPQVADIKPPKVMPTKKVNNPKILTDTSEKEPIIRKVTAATIEKWKSELVDFAVNEWLYYEKDASGVPTALFCKFCTDHEEEIKSIDGFTNQYTKGSTNFRKSTVEYHAKNTKSHTVAHGLHIKSHTVAYELHIKSHTVAYELHIKSHTVAYELHVKSHTVAYELHIKESGKDLKKLKKFKHSAAGSSDVLEGISTMEKMKWLGLKLNLKQHILLQSKNCHLRNIRKYLNMKNFSVDTGDAYMTDVKAGEFTDFIAADLKSKLCKDVATANFFSVLSDGSTDSAVIEEEIIYVSYFDPNPPGKDEFAVKIEFLGIQPLASQSANGVHKVIVDSIEDLHIINDKHGFAEEKYFSETSMCKQIVGFTSDRALVNRGENASVKTLLRETSPWVVFTWCIAHRLELSVKDSLSNEREFKEIDEMSLRLYYLYHKAPKKLRQLRELSHALAGAMEYHEGSVKPYKASGTRWITHKVKAMKIILMNWGVYIMHLENLTNDKSVPAGDRNKLKGYLKTWSQSKISFLLALFIDVLSVVSDLSLVFQSDSIDVVSFCDAISKAKRQMERLQERSFETMPFVKNLLSKIEEKEQKFFT